MDKEVHIPGKNNKIEMDDGNKFLSHEESRKVFTAMANENGAVRAFKVLRDSLRVRKSLHTNLKNGKDLVKTYRQRSEQLRKN